MLVQMLFGRDWPCRALNDSAHLLDGGTVLHRVLGMNITGEIMWGVESFWMAETLKYLYLMFAEDMDVQVRSDGKMKWVLNTEAHPLLIRGA